MVLQRYCATYAGNPTIQELDQKLGTMGGMEIVMHPSTQEVYFTINPGKLTEVRKLEEIMACSVI